MLGDRPAREAAVDEADDHAASLPAGTARSSRRLPVLRLTLRRSPAPGSPWRDPVIWAIAAASFGAYLVISLYKLLQARAYHL